MQYLKVIKAIFEELTPCPWPKIPTSGGSLSNPSERCRRMMVEYITDSNFDQKPRPEDFHYASQSNVSRGEGGGEVIIFPIPSLVSFLRPAHFHSLENKFRWKCQKSDNILLLLH